MPNHELSVFSLKFLKWASGLENSVLQKLFCFFVSKLPFKACCDFKAVNKVMSCLGWVLNKMWLYGWFILWNQSAEDFKSPAMNWKKASS